MEKTNTTNMNTWSGFGNKKAYSEYDNMLTEFSGIDWENNNILTTTLTKDNERGDIIFTIHFLDENHNVVEKRYLDDWDVTPKRLAANLFTWGIDVIPQLMKNTFTKEEVHTINETTCDIREVVDLFFEQDEEYKEFVRLGKNENDVADIDKILKKRGYIYLRFNEILDKHQDGLALVSGIDFADFYMVGECFIKPNLKLLEKVVKMYHLREELKRHREELAQGIY